MTTVSFNEIGIYLNKIQSDSEFSNCAFGRSLMRIIYLNSKKPKNLRNKICSEAVVTAPSVLYTQKDFFLLHELNSQIGRMKAAGLIQFWNSKYSEAALRDEPDLSIRKVLTVYDLSGCIQIWIFGCVTSLVIFVMEIISRIAFKNCCKTNFW